MNATYLGLMAASDMCVKYDTTGNAVARVNTAGQKVESAWTSTTNYQRPSVVTPNSDTGLAQTMQYNTFLGLTHLDSPNGVSQTFGWYSAARPASVQSAHGAVTAMTYSGDGRETTATVNGKFVRTTVDGLGRTVKVERGHGETVVSVVETEYGACACSALGRVKKISRPYAPGQTVLWTSYTYL